MSDHTAARFGGPASWGRRHLSKSPASPRNDPAVPLPMRSSQVFVAFPKPKTSLAIPPHQRFHSSIVLRAAIRCPEVCSNASARDLYVQMSRNGTGDSSPSGRSQASRTSSQRTSSGISAGRPQRLPSRKLDRHGSSANLAFHFLTVRAEMLSRRAISSVPKPLRACNMIFARTTTACAARCRRTSSFSSRRTVRGISTLCGTGPRAMLI